jgi:hypothetical protein
MNRRSLIFQIGGLLLEYYLSELQTIYSSYAVQYEVGTISYKNTEQVVLGRSNRVL